MLKNIPPIISPRLMYVLMQMGHGDEIVLGDGNFPAASVAKSLIRCDGLGISALLEAILQFFPLDYATEHPVLLMNTPPGIDCPVIWEDYTRIVARYDKPAREFGRLERFAFYERARRAYAIVATSESARFANIILKKGVVTIN